MPARPAMFVAAISVTASFGCSPVLDAPDSTFIVPPRFEHYLQAPRPQPHAHFGDRVALRGNALAITAPFEATTGDPIIPEGAADGYAPDGEGAAYLFDLTQPTAAPLRIVAPNADPGDGKLQDAALQISTRVMFPNLPSMYVALDDDWLAIGVAGEDSALQPDADPSAAEANNDAEDAGAVYLYARSRLAAGDLMPAQYLKAPNIGPDDYFGASVAFVGTQLIVGAPGEDSGRNDDPSDESAAESGAVYVYTLQDDQFVFSQYLKEPAPILTNQLFGFSLSADGDLLAVGAPFDSSASTEIGGVRVDTSSVGDGAAYLYRNQNGTWQFEEYLKPSEPRAESIFGWSVRVADGRVAVGAPGAANCADETIGVPQRGSAYTFELASAGWSLDRCFAPAARRNDFFGGSLAWMNDRLLAGAGWDASGRLDHPQDSTRTFSGAAYLEARTDSAWRQRAYIKAPRPETNDVFGAALDLDERFVAIGAAQRSSNEVGAANPVYSGAVYVFDANLDLSAR